MNLLCSGDVSLRHASLGHTPHLCNGGFDHLHRENNSGISANFLNQVRHRKLGNYLSCRGSLCNGIDPKQAGVGVRDVEGSGLKDNQRLSDVE